MAFLFPLAIFVLTLNGKWSSDYPVSILGMQYAMWANHSFSMGTPSQPLVQSVDLALYQGRYYSAISPGLAILALPFAALGFKLDGSTLNLLGNALLMDEFFLAIAASVATVMTYKISRFFASPVSSLLASFALAFASPLWPATTVLFIQAASLMFATASIYLLLRHTKGRGGIGSLVASGILLGLAGFVEYAALLLVVPMAGYLIVRTRKRALPVFLSGFIIGPLLQLAYNFAAFGSALTFPEQLKAGASVGLLSRFDLLGALGHADMYLLSPYRGILVFSPVVVLGFYSLYRMVKSRELRAEAFLFLGIFLVVLAFYSSWGDWSGGEAYGPRFLTLTLPGLIVPIAVLLERDSSRGIPFLFTLLFGAGSLIEGVGALTTAFSVTGNTLTFQPLALNVSWLLNGNLDSWVVAGLGGPAGLISWAFVPAILFSVWSVVLVATGGWGKLPGGKQLDSFRDFRPDEEWSNNRDKPSS